MDNKEEEGVTKKKMHRRGGKPTPFHLFPLLLMGCFATGYLNRPGPTCPAGAIALALLDHETTQYQFRLYQSLERAEGRIAVVRRPSEQDSPQPYASLIGTLTVAPFCTVEENTHTFTALISGHF